MNAKLAELGAELRQAREAQKRSLEDLSRATLVHIRHLAAIEEGRDEDLPEAFYVKHFIRRYAGAVGLPPDDLAGRFWETQPLDPVATPSSGGGPALTVSWWLLPVLFGTLMLGIVGTLAINSLHPRRVPSGAQLAAAPRASERPAPVVRTGRPASASALAARTGPALHPSPAAAAAKVAAAPSPAAASPGPAAQASGSLETILPATAIAFQAHTTEASWMDIVSDGKEVFSDVVPAGHTVKWGAKDALSVRIGNPGSVYGVINSRPLGLLGNQTTSVFRHTFLTAAAAKQRQAHASEARPAPRDHAKPHAGKLESGPAAGKLKSGPAAGKPLAVKVRKPHPAGARKPAHPAATRAPGLPSHPSATGSLAEPAPSPWPNQ